MKRWITMQKRGIMLVFSIFFSFFNYFRKDSGYQYFLLSQHRFLHFILCLRQDLLSKSMSLSLSCTIQSSTYRWVRAIHCIGTYNSIALTDQITMLRPFKTLWERGKCFCITLLMDKSFEFCCKLQMPSILMSPTFRSVKAI